ncbi:DUF3846 domain-containing protein (plasmid) [Pontibacillus sp. ALD_SL1]|uniref:DUF3846 domain-containing protein n=1 Tax=Pontibacillus sp. ALD_SL1 TaxID=2777185 RepID=UPI001A96A328|nr:DUF3846 domain-containing protein [Pontibacillus sp. ALD_SL1]QST02855.1 DUF3846 domain-containing protein [Pontibacillus sp. ALD_SL1]
MRVVTKRVGEPLKQGDVSLTIENMQKMVGGYIEQMYLPHGILAFYNEDAKLLKNGSGPNFVIRAKGKPTQTTEGDVFFCAFDDDGNNRGLSVEQMKWLNDSFELVGNIECEEKRRYPLYALTLD